MKRIMMMAISFLMMTTLNAAEFEFDPKVVIALGVRGGTNQDINDKPAVYAGGKMTHFEVGNSYHKMHFLVPGIGV